MSTAEEVHDDIPVDEMEHVSLVQRFQTWFMEDAIWWVSSMMFHMTALLVLAFIGTTVEPKVVGDAPAFDSPRWSRRCRSRIWRSSRSAKRRRRPRSCRRKR